MKKTLTSGSLGLPRPRIVPDLVVAAPLPPTLVGSKLIFKRLILDSFLPVEHYGAAIVSFVTSCVCKNFSTLRGWIVGFYSTALLLKLKISSVWFRGRVVSLMLLQLLLFSFNFKLQIPTWTVSKALFCVRCKAVAWVIVGLWWQHHRTGAQFKDWQSVIFRGWVLSFLIGVGLSVREWCHFIVVSVLLITFSSDVFASFSILQIKVIVIASDRFQILYFRIWKVLLQLMLRFPCRLFHWYLLFLNWRLDILTCTMSFLGVPRPVWLQAVFPGPQSLEISL